MTPTSFDTARSAQRPLMVDMILESNTTLYHPHLEDLVVICTAAFAEIRAPDLPRAGLHRLEDAILGEGVDDATLR